MKLHIHKLRRNLTVLKSQAYRLCVVGLVCMIGDLGCAVGRAEEPQKIALLIGVSEYADPKFADLRFANDDVAAVGLQLKAMGFTTGVLTGNQATREGVTGAIEKLLQRTEKMESDAVVLLMFSGHGQQLKVLQPSSDGESRADELPFFCPSDAINFDPTQHELRDKTAAQVAAELRLISLNEIIDGLDRRSNSRRNLLVVDACRSNPAKGRAAGISGNAAVDLPSGISILFAAGSGQKSWESNDANVPSGVMTHYLLKGLRGEARNRRSEITWSRLVTYVREEVENDAGKLAGGPDRSQSPHAIMNDDELIVLNPLAKNDTAWNRFRGPGGTGIVQGAIPPLQWSKTKNVKWKVALPGRGASSPVVFANNVVVTAYSGYGIDADNVGEMENLRRHVICFDLVSGKRKWELTFKPKGEEKKYFQYLGYHGYATSTPALNESGVYVWLGTSGIIAIDWSGSNCQMLCFEFMV